MAHWHEHNPWADRVVYVPLEELAECVAGGNVTLSDGTVVPYTAEFVLDRWSGCGERLDAYVLPQPNGRHSIGVRFGMDGPEYLSPYPQHRDRLEELLRRYSNEYAAGIAPGGP